MAGDIENKKFLEEEVRPVIQNEIPTLRVMIKQLQKKVTALERAFRQYKAE